MAKNTAKQQQDRARMVALYKNLGKSYIASMTYLDAIFIKLAGAVDLMREAGETGKALTQVEKILKNTTLLMQEGEKAKEINAMEVEKLSESPLKEFNYEEAEKSNQSFLRAVVTLAKSAENVLESTSQKRVNIAEHRRSSVSRSDLRTKRA